MRELTAADVLRHLAFQTDAARVTTLAEAVARNRALIEGHFSLHDGRHSPVAIRLRAMARDGKALDEIAALLHARATWRWSEVTIVSPDTAGFLLASHLQRIDAGPHAVVRTDLRRRPTTELMTGTVAGAAVVIVNDIYGTGAAAATMQEVVEAQGGRVVGVVVFAALDLDHFIARCNQVGAAPIHLASARWSACRSGDAHCAGCGADAPLIPVAEFA